MPISRSDVTLLVKTFICIFFFFVAYQSNYVTKRCHLSWHVGNEKMVGLSVKCLRNKHVLIMQWWVTYPMTRYTTHQFYDLLITCNKSQVPILIIIHNITKSTELLLAIIAVFTTLHWLHQCIFLCSICKIHVHYCEPFMFHVNALR